MNVELMKRRLDEGARIALAELQKDDDLERAINCALHRAEWMDTTENCYLMFLYARFNEPHAFQDAECMYSETGCFPHDADSDKYIGEMAEHCFYYCVRSRVCGRFCK